MIPANQITTSLAILLVNWDKGKSYIDNFVPFIGQCIVTVRPKVVSVPELQQKMQDDYGLRIPQNSLKTILKRVAKKGYIQPEHNAYVPDYEALKRLDFETTRQQVLRKHNAIIEKLIKFASGRYGTTLTTEAAENMLLLYIRQHDIELLNCSVGIAPIADVEGQFDKAKHFMINAFVKYNYENDPEGFEYLDTIVKGHMLANALIFPDLGQLERRFRRTSVYCDTALILRILGYEGNARKAPCIELIELLREVGADIRCFQHTRDEIYNILFACKSALASLDARSAYGPAFHYFFESGYRPVDIELELATLDKRLESVGIRIVEKPEYIDEYQIDEERLEQALEAEAKYWRERERARIHDIDCLSAVYRLRKGQSHYNIEDCKVVFVTPNSTLCRVSWQFFVEGNYIREGSVPIAITDYTLTNILWLKKPMAAPDLPQKYIIAECYAAMEPGERLWRMYSDEISKLKEREEISSDEYYLLRYTQQARTELMDTTMGDEDAVVEGTPREILERIMQGIRQEDLAKVAAERRLREEKERELRLERAKNKEREDSLRLNIQRKSERTAFFISRVVFGILIVLLASGAFYCLLGPQLSWWNLALFIIAIIFILVTLYNLFFRTSVKDLLGRFEVFITENIQRLLKTWFLP